MIVTIHDLRLDTIRRTVSLRGDSVQLTGAEIRLLDTLLREPSRWHSFRQLQEICNATQIHVVVGALKRRLSQLQADLHLLIYTCNDTGTRRYCVRAGFLPQGIPSAHKTRVNQPYKGRVSPDQERRNIMEKYAGPSEGWRPGSFAWLSRAAGSNPAPTSGITPVAEPKRNRITYIR